MLFITDSTIEMATKFLIMFSDRALFKFTVDRSFPQIDAVNGSDSYHFFLQLSETSFLLLIELGAFELSL